MIFHDALGFVVIHERFFNDIFRFLVVKCFFNDSVGFFGFKQFVTQCCARFFFSLELAGLSPNQDLAKS